MRAEGWDPVHGATPRGTVPAENHGADPARRQVGESTGDYADRIYGMYRAAITDLASALTVQEIRDAPTRAAAVHRAQTFAVKAWDAR